MSPRCHRSRGQFCRQLRKQFTDTVERGQGLGASAMSCCWTCGTGEHQRQQRKHLFFPNHTWKGQAVSHPESTTSPAVRQADERSSTKIATSAALFQATRGCLTKINTQKGTIMGFFSAIRGTDVLTSLQQGKRCIPWTLSSQHIPLPTSKPRGSVCRAAGTTCSCHTQSLMGPDTGAVTNLT